MDPGVKLDETLYNRQIEMSANEKRNVNNYIF